MSKTGSLQSKPPKRRSSISEVEELEILQNMDENSHLTPTDTSNRGKRLQIHRTPRLERTHKTKRRKTAVLPPSVSHSGIVDAPLSDEEQKEYLDCLRRTILPNSQSRGDFEGAIPSIFRVRQDIDSKKSPTVMRQILADLKEGLRIQAVVNMMAKKALEAKEHVNAELTKLKEDKTGEWKAPKPRAEGEEGRIYGYSEASPSGHAGDLETTKAKDNVRDQRDHDLVETPRAFHGGIGENSDRKRDDRQETESHRRGENSGIDHDGEQRNIVLVSLPSQTGHNIEGKNDESVETETDNLALVGQLQRGIPAERISDVRKTEMLRELRQQYDFLVSDMRSVPNTVVGDTQIMQRFHKECIKPVQQNLRLLKVCATCEEVHTTGWVEGYENVLKLHQWLQANSAPQNNHGLIADVANIILLTKFYQKTCEEEVKAKSLGSVSLSPSLDYLETGYRTMPMTTNITPNSETEIKPLPNDAEEPLPLHEPQISGDVEASMKTVTQPISQGLPAASSGSTNSLVSEAIIDPMDMDISGQDTAEPLCQGSTTDYHQRPPETEHSTTQNYLAVEIEADITPQEMDLEVIQGSPSQELSTTILRDATAWNHQRTPFRGMQVEEKANTAHVAYRQPTQYVPTEPQALSRTRITSEQLHRARKHMRSCKWGRNCRRRETCSFNHTCKYSLSNEVCPLGTVCDMEHFYAEPTKTHDSLSRSRRVRAESPSNTKSCHVSAHQPKYQKLCKWFQRAGSCRRGNDCEFTHALENSRIENRDHAEDLSQGEETELQPREQGLHRFKGKESLRHLFYNMDLQDDEAGHYQSNIMGSLGNNETTLSFSTRDSHPSISYEEMATATTLATMRQEREPIGNRRLRYNPSTEHQGPEPRARRKRDRSPLDHGRSSTPERNIFKRARKDSNEQSGGRSEHLFTGTNNVGRHSQQGQNKRATTPQWSKRTDQSENPVRSFATFEDFKNASTPWRGREGRQSGLHNYRSSQGQASRGDQSKNNIGDK